MVNTLNDAEMYLSFDNIDQVSGNPQDLSGNTTATNNGATTGAVGLINECYDFNGSSDYVSQNLGVTSYNNWSINFWIKPDSGFSLFQAMRKEKQVSIYITDTGVIGFYIGNGSSWSTLISSAATTITSDSWSMITFTGDGSTIRGYVNNVEIGNNANTYNLNMNGVRLFANDGGSQYLEGLGDEFGIWTRALSSDERATLYNDGDGFNPYKNLDDAELYYSMDDDNTSSGNPQDLSGNDNHGTNTGVTTSSSGILNEGYDYDNSGDLTTSNSFDLDLTSAFTINFWFRPSETGHYIFKLEDAALNNRIWMVGQAATYPYYVYYKGNGTDSNGDVNGFNGDTTYSDDEFHMMTVVYLPSINKLYFYDAGVKVSERSFTTDMVGTVITLKLGMGFIGGIDEVSIYSRLLSQYEINTLYNSGAAYNPYDVTPSGYSNKVNGITNYSKINGLIKANINKFNKV